MRLSHIIAEVDKQINTPIVAVKFGLAERYYENAETFFPGILSERGEVTNCFLQDTSPLTYYHRQSRGVMRELNREDYGDKSDKVIEVNEIELVAFATDINFTPLQVCDVFIAAIPSYLSKSVCESIGIEGCRIIVTSYDTDPVRIWREETSEPKVRAGLNKALIKVRYTLECTYRRGCIDPCEKC
jgi:hypothetical protein